MIQRLGLSNAKKEDLSEKGKCDEEEIDIDIVLGRLPEKSESTEIEWTRKASLISNCLLKNIFQNKVESSVLVYIIHQSRHVVCRWPSRNLNCFKLPPHGTSVECLLTVKMEAVSIALRVPYSPANHQGLCPLWAASVSSALGCK
ncbi:hypothetical protein AVEN_191440-1, partial [Araneus ventricosus]